MPSRIADIQFCGLAFHVKMLSRGSLRTITLPKTPECGGDCTSQCGSKRERVAPQQGEPRHTDPSVAGIPNFAEVSPSLYRGCEPGFGEKGVLHMTAADLARDTWHVISSIPHIKPALHDLACDFLTDMRGLTNPSPSPFLAMKEMGIKTIINLRLFDSHDREALKGSGMSYIHIPFDPFHPRTDAVVKFLKVATSTADQPAFVHCEDGVDRTGLMCAVYRMVVQGWSAKQAVAEMEKFKAHPVFKDLKEYLRKLNVEEIRSLVAAAPMPPVELIR